MTSEYKIKGKFYPLKHSELLSVAHANLTRFEIIVLYYIRTLDPYSNGVEINASQIAKDLSTEEKVVCRQTVSRALKKLEKDEYIDLEIIRAIVKLSGKGELVSANTSGVCTHQAEPTDTKLNLQTPLETSSHHKEPTDTTDIYIDRARAKDSSDFSKSSDLEKHEENLTEVSSVDVLEEKTEGVRPEKEENQAVAVAVEIVTETEEEIQAKLHSSVEREKSEIQARDFNPGGELLFAPRCDNNAQLQKRTRNRKAKPASISPEQEKAFLDAYLAEKPSNFVKHTEILKKDLGSINKLVQEHGDQAFEKFVAAVIWIRERGDGLWYKSETSHSLKSIFTNDKIPEYADKHRDAMENDPRYRARVNGEAPSMDKKRVSPAVQMRQDKGYDKFRQLLKTTKVI